MGPSHVANALLWWGLPAGGRGRGCVGAEGVREISTVPIHLCCTPKNKIYYKYLEGRQEQGGKAFPPGEPAKGEGKEGVGPRTQAPARVEGGQGTQVGQGGDATVVWI